MHIAKQGDADDEIVEFSSDEGSPRQQVPCYGENGCSEFAEKETSDKPMQHGSTSGSYELVAVSPSVDGG